MADDVTLPGTGDVVAADDVSGVKYQRVKLDIGGDGVSSPVVSGNPLPVSGTVTANAGTNLNTSALALESGGNLAAIATDAAAIEALLTTIDADTSRIPALGQATMAASAPVVIASNQSAVPVSGPLTDTELRATAVPVSLASVPSHAVTNAGTFAVQESGAALTALQLIDDPVATSGSAIPAKGMAVSGTDGTNARVLKTDTSGELQVDVLTLPNVTIGAAIPAGTNNIGDVDVLSLPALPAGTNAIGKLAANSGVDIGDVDVLSMPDAVAVGKAAHDAAVSGAPVRIGAKSLAWAAAVTDVSADGDVVDFIADRSGRQYIAENHPNSWNVNGEYSGAQTNTSLKAAPGAGLSLYITDVIISNGATAGSCKLIDGSGGATKVGTFYFAINGGCVIRFKTPVKMTSNTALCFTSATMTTHSVTVCGYTAP